MELMTLRARLLSLSAYRTLKDTPILSRVIRLLDELKSGAGEEALDSYAALFHALRSEGFSLEERPFAAHLTLARQVDAPGLRPEEIPLEKCYTLE